MHTVTTSRPRALARALPRALALVALILAGAAPLHAQRLTLQEAIDHAQQRGFRAEAARNALESARWNERAFNARLKPQLSLTGEAPNINRAIITVVQPDGTTLFVPQSQMQSSFGLRMSQRVPGTGGQLYIQSGLSRLDLFGDRNSRVYQSTPVMVGFQQELFRPNTLAWSNREQDIRTTIAERQYAEAREDVASATASAFFDVYTARLALVNAEANAAVNDTLFTLSKGRYEVGKISENELLQSELALLRAQNAVDGARVEEARALAAFKLLLNVPASANVDITPPAEVPALNVDTALAVQQALRNRAQQSEFELQALQARRALNEARLSNGFGATINASAGLNQTSPVFGDAYRSPLDQQRFGLSVEMPLYQWGAGRAEVQAARAEQGRVASNVKAGRASLEQEAHFAALQLALQGRQLLLSAKADTVAGKRFEVAKNRYVIGKIGIGELYIAQSEKDAAVQAYAQSMRGYWLAYYRLRRLTLYDFALGRPIVGG